MASIKKRPDGKYRARYRDEAGREHARHFDRKVDGQKWLDQQTAALVSGTHVDPKTAKTTVAAWCATWLDGYGTRRASTVRQAKVHVAQIVAEFGPLRLSAVRPSHVKAWTTKLRESGLAASYVYALYRRLAQIFADAVHDGIVPRSPCSRRTSPGQAKQRPYVATTEQVWGLYDAMPARQRASILLGAFAGLRTAEACGLRVADVDFMRGMIAPAVQYPALPLKTEASQTPIPISRTLAVELSAHVAQWRADTILTADDGVQFGPWMLERAIRDARQRVPGLPDGFRFHDLRHYFASLLIESGASVKVVQARLRHGSAKTTLDTYGHMFPDSDEATRSAVDAVLVARADSLRTREVIA
ncbi:site-specific integrase [Micromonospora fulviviridis]|uniref:site-specific integrase n=1 Tax=Micromonospora fulviviridis TaxID=47860 RepID=UPI00166BFFEB|nr:site-specific integrase [Micromonospora fulviviridis]GGR80242.1 site-specific integrase [Micromonospora fulviviridis]